MSDQRSSSRRSTCNDEVLPDVLGDQIHLKEVYIILHLRNMLLKALESRRNLGEKNQENNRMLIFNAYENLLRTNLARPVGPILLFISFSYKSKNNKFNFAMAFKKINDVSCKDSTIATFVDISDVYPITRREVKTSALNEFEYFTSLEMARKSKSQRTLKTAIPEGNIASKLFNELSHSGFNFSESKNSTDSSISTKVNSLMVDATDMDEKFAMMEQTIEALKKSIDDKNLQIAELMSKLDLYNSGESHHILTAHEKVDIDSPTKPVDSQSAKRSTFVATLTVQQLQDMITNTIKSQYGGPPQSSLGYSKPYSKRIEGLLMPIGY